MPEKLAVSVMGGPVSVTFRKRGKDWVCTALQFDLVGIGRTREEAFQALRDVVALYLSEILRSEGSAQVVNKSDPQEWQVKDKHEYRVVAILAQREKEPKIPVRMSGLKRARDYRSRIRSFDLAPV